VRSNEAKHIEMLLASLATEAMNPCLNIGSSTAHYRTVEQPHVNAHVFQPLRERGVRIINLDMKEDEGVDLVGDVLDPAFQAKLATFHPRLVMCTNLLEHLTDPIAFSHACAGIVEPGGFLLVSGPYGYPYHPDPIDTLYRPGPDEIRRLFPGFTCLHEAIVPDGTYLDDLLGQNTPRQLTRLIASHVLKFPYLLLTDLERFKNRYHRYLWLFRQYEFSIVLLHRSSVSIT
jgi:hypothetical protein